MHGFNMVLIFVALKLEHLNEVPIRTHRIGCSYIGRITNKKCKSIIMRFTTLQHRTLFYRARKSGLKVKLDLTKSRFNLWKKANDHVREIRAIWFCYGDVNCCLRVKFHDAKQEDIFFLNLWWVVWYHK